ncbi:MAG: PEP-CTERM sorting domain-containing protein [Candidatus Pacebacteria bacterium]|nr:PEP-CTERM sorting domain-containing protein [Candidatus Paceibacterota bacterium]
MTTVSPPDFIGDDAFTIDGAAGTEDGQRDRNTSLGAYVGAGSIQFNWAGNTYEAAVYDPGSANVFGGSMEHPTYSWEAEVIMTSLPVIPEPSTIVLLALGGIALFRRRRHA